jgi:hypothetical protein
MQVPAQALLDAPALVNDRVATIDQQLQLPKRLFVRARPTQTGLAQRRPRDRERVDRVRLAAAFAGAPLRRHQLRRHPDELLTGRKQLPLEPTRQPPTVLHRPETILLQSRSPTQQIVVANTGGPLVEHAPSLVDGHRGHDCLCTSTPITIICIASKAVGGDRRADRPQSRRKPRSYQVTLDALGRRRRHNTRQSALGRHRECESAAAARVCASYRTPPPAENDIECGNVPAMLNVEPRG